MDWQSARPVISPYFIEVAVRRSTTRPTVVANPNRLIARPRSSAPRTDPPSDSRTTVAPACPCTACSALSRTKAMNWRAVSAVTMPEAPISGRHAVAQASADPSANKAKRMGDELSALPATGSAGAEGVSPSADESASRRHIDASVLGNERHIPDPCHRGIGACPAVKCLLAPVPRGAGPEGESESLASRRIVAHPDAARDLLPTARHMISFSLDPAPHNVYG